MLGHAACHVGMMMLNRHEAYLMSVACGGERAYRVEA